MKPQTVSSAGHAVSDSKGYRVDTLRHHRAEDPKNGIVHRDAGGLGTSRVRIARRLGNGAAAVRAFTWKTRLMHSPACPTGPPVAVRILRLDRDTSWDTRPDSRHRNSRVSHRTAVPQPKFPLGNRAALIRWRTAADPDLPPPWVASVRTHESGFCQIRFRNLALPPSAAVRTRNS